MNDFVTVCTVDQFPASGVYCTDLDDRFIVITRLGDEYYCIDDVCTHDGGPLGEGALDGTCLTCPRHGAQFDVRTGEAVTMPATEPTTKHEVQLVGNEIRVKLSA